jgi:hypothetical protein
LILFLAGFGVAQLAPALGLIKADPGLRGARIPQYDPFALGPPPFEDADSEPME